jgi:hypothetical protein
MANLVHRQYRKMHKNEDIFVKQAQKFSPRLFYFALWHGGQTSDKGEKNPSLF